MRQQFPFYNELQTIFGARMQRMLWMEAEGGLSATKKKGVQLSSDDEDDNEESDGGEKITSSKKRRKVLKGGGNGSSTSGTSMINSLKVLLEEFMKQQMQMEMEWMKAYERREEERRVKEMEWRQTMEALENERVAMERRWREREDERRTREEARAEKRDALITALLNKLRREEM